MHKEPTQLNKDGVVYLLGAGEEELVPAAARTAARRHEHHALRAQVAHHAARRVLHYGTCGGGHGDGHCMMYIDCTELCSRHHR